MKPPFQHVYDLADLSAAGAEVAIRPKADERAALARWVGVDDVAAFEGRVSLRKLSQTRFSYDAELSAEVVQACVVTLDPVRSRIARHFSRTLHLGQGPAAAREPVLVSPGDDESPEEIASPRYDLAAPLIEELALEIDPYPRAAGVAFEPPGGDDEAEGSPFAVLKQLKKGP
ncbi:MAG TPA: DUF177 domain-containing protein [Rhizomicrobium sp.]|nr:DUF177 domain-containing protein [Rhizomicrobium sp.]